MPRQMLNALDIGEGQRGWTCIVQVIERHPVLYKELTYYPFQKRYRNYLLTDMQGTKIKAVMFDKDIDFFQRSLVPFKRYKISNAYVSLGPEQFRLPVYSLSWTINQKTPVELIVDDRPYTIPCSFDVCPFTELHKHAEADTNIAIKALVVHSFPVVDITPTRSAHDYVVIDEQEIPMVMRLWQNLLADYDPSIDSFRKAPVTIIASNLEVKTFHGLSLATRRTAYLIENPPLAEDLDLKNWYAKKKARVAELLENKAYENNTQFFPHPNEEQILTLKQAMEAFKTVKTCWIKAKLQVCVTRFPMYEIICANCQMLVDADIDWNVECSGCTVISPMEVRYNIAVTLNDEDMNIKSTLKTPYAEKLAPYSAAEFRKQEAEGMSPTHDLIIAMDYTEVVCFLKYYDKNIAGELVRRYVILKTYKPAELKTQTPGESSTVETTVNLDSTTAASVIAETPLLPPNSDKQPGSENEFFTPTTRKVLEEAAQKHGLGQSSTPQASNVKRTITFGSIVAEDLQRLDSKDNEVTQSPQKKNKGEDKQV